MIFFHVQNNDNQFSVVTLLGMARGVASGMKYLSELGFIHRVSENFPLSNRS